MALVQEVEEVVVLLIDIQEVAALWAEIVAKTEVDSAAYTAGYEYSLSFDLIDQKLFVVSMLIHSH